MQSPRVAKRYAQALFDLSKEKKTLDAVAGEMKDLQTVISNTKELRDFVLNPVLTEEQKKQVIRSLFEKKMNEFVLNFLLFLTDKRRLNLIEGICDVFDKLYLDYKNIADIQITSVFTMDQSEVDAVCRKLKEKFQKEMQAHVVTDPGLIGGLKLKIQDIVYDFSFKTQLEKFRQGIT